jgi:hypothetical protein
VQKKSSTTPIAEKRAISTPTAEKKPVLNPNVTKNTTSPQVSAEPVATAEKKVPATEFIPTRAPVSAPRPRSNPRPRTPVAIPEPGAVKIPFSNSSRSTIGIEFMSPIRQRNALEALEASISAHAEDPMVSNGTADVPARSTTPTTIRRAKEPATPAADSGAESRASGGGGGGWNSNCKVKYPSANEVAIEHIQLIQMESGEKPLPPRSTIRKSTGLRSATPSGSRSATPTSHLTTRRSQDDSSVHSGASSQNRRSLSAGRSSRSAASLLSPYNMMAANGSLDVAKLTENDLKTIGKQLLLLKLLLESKMAADAEQEEQDLLYAWQTVRDAEEQARALAGEDLGTEEITRVHQHVAEMVRMLVFIYFLQF